MGKQDLTDFGMSADKKKNPKWTLVRPQNQTPPLLVLGVVGPIHLDSKKKGQKSIDYNHILHEQVPPELHLCMQQRNMNWKMGITPPLPNLL